MPEFSDKAPYLKQIAIYFQQEAYQKAYLLSEEFVQKFPKILLSHFLLAKSAFWTDDFETAKKEGLLAFNLANGEYELEITGILLACIYYRLKEYRKGMDLVMLLNYKLQTKENLMKLKFLFALALNDESVAMRYLDMLYEINREEAKKLLSKFIPVG